MLISLAAGGAGFLTYKMGQKNGRKQQANITPLPVDEILENSGKDATGDNQRQITDNVATIKNEENIAPMERNPPALLDDSMGIERMVEHEEIDYEPVVPNKSAHTCKCGGTCKTCKEDELNNLLALLIAEIEEIDEANLGNAESNAILMRSLEIKEQKPIEVLKRSRMIPTFLDKKLSSNLGARFNSEKKKRFLEKVIKKLHSLPNQEDKIAFLKNQILEIRHKKAQKSADDLSKYLATSSLKPMDIDPTRGDLPELNQEAIALEGFDILSLI